MFTNEYIDIMNEYGYVQQIQNPTRLSKTFNNVNE